MSGYSAVSYDKFYTYAYSILSVAVIDMQPLLTKSAPTFVNIYGELPVEQKEVGTWADTVLLMSKLILMCGNMRVFLYFCRVTQSELACDTRVNFHVEHASSISCTAQDPSLCAAQL